MVHDQQTQGCQESTKISAVALQEVPRGGPPRKLENGKSCVTRTQSIGVGLGLLSRRMNGLLSVSHPPHMGAGFVFAKWAPGRTYGLELNAAEHVRMTSRKGRVRVQQCQHQRVPVQKARIQGRQARDRGLRLRHLRSKGRRAKSGRRRPL